MALVRVTDHTRRAILNLPPAFWGKPRIASCVRAITDEIQELEDTLFEVLEIRLIDNADLARLKTLGRLVGEPYLGHDVETYRKLVKLRIRMNNGHGTISDVLAVCELAGIGTRQWADGSGAAMLSLILEDAPTVGFLLLQSVLRGAIAAGVTPYVWFTTDEHGALVADSSDTVTFDNDATVGDGSGAVPDVGSLFWYEGYSL